jgi:cytochrome oxidase Cu insertion factor (SCO1/SenC/PrrC family)
MGKQLLVSLLILIVLPTILGLALLQHNVGAQVAAMEDEAVYKTHNVVVELINSYGKSIQTTTASNAN